MQLIAAIARREGTARQLAERFDRTTDELREFVKTHNSAIENFLNSNVDDESVVTPTQLDELWISNKFERLRRYETICDSLFKVCQDTPDAVALRELRSYLLAASNELGQLMHRGSGDAGTGDSLHVEIQGIDLDNLR
jgi:hypothetical protein